MPNDRWENASAYERFMGRWSRLLARKFVAWLNVPPSANWMEIGCGTGSLTRAICESAQPKAVLACDTAPDYVKYCREHLRFPGLEVVHVPPDSLAATSSHDAVVSSLVLNFLPSPVEALVRMREACAPQGSVAACVWDYSEGMEFLRIFWETAVTLHPQAAPLHEGARFPLCKPDALRNAFLSSGLHSIQLEALSVSTTFESFDDFWSPFLDGPGPAPTYLSSLSGPDRQRLERRLRSVLADFGDYPIKLRARAWAVTGVS